MFDIDSTMGVNGLPYFMEWLNSEHSREHGGF